MANLYLTARPDERFHLQTAQPWCQAFGRWDWLYRGVRWYDMTRPNGSRGRFDTYIFLWFFRWYKGTVKCDGTRTRMFRHGQLGSPYDQVHFVMTTTPKEMFSVRLRWRKPDRERWDNMGGI
jgi:hypothetical protein